MTPLEATKLQKPLARKSCGEYKAIVLHPCGRTEILGQKIVPLIWVPMQASMRPLPDGPTKSVRGTTFKTRDEDIEAAQKVISSRVEDLEKKLSDPRYRALREQHRLFRELVATP